MLFVLSCIWILDLQLSFWCMLQNIVYIIQFDSPSVVSKSLIFSLTALWCFLVFQSVQIIFE